jgi:hypothetical protein
MQQHQPMQAMVSFTNPIQQTGKASNVSQSPYINNPLSPNKGSADGEGSTHDSSEGQPERGSTEDELKFFNAPSNTANF